jgi:hypothetical protein
MTTVPFDTLALARKLEAAGFPAQQAQDVSAALAEVMAADLATKRDIQDLRAEIALATRDLKIWTAGLAGVVIAALSALRFFA